ncbi:MAG: ABC transporter permease [Sulfolobales archaeon]
MSSLGSKLILGLGRILSFLREYVLSQLAGRISIALLAFLVIMSIYALVSLPPSFPVEWTQPQAWEMYPPNAPPEWAWILGYPCLKHVMENLAQHKYSIIQTSGGIDLSYTYTYTLPEGLNRVPSNILVLVKDLYIPQGATNINIILTVRRPDNYTYTLISYTTPVSPNTSYISATLRLSSEMLARDIVNQYLQERGWLINSLSILGSLQELIFKKVTEVSPAGIVVNSTILPGDYLFKLDIVYSGVYTPPITVAKELTLVIFGTCYGLMGTDYLGRDLYMGLLYGFPIALAIGLSVAILSTAIGVLAGIVSGFYGGLIDEGIQRTVDVMGNIPLLPILVLIATSVQASQFIAQIQDPVAKGWTLLSIILIVLVVFGWPGLAIIIRSFTLSIKGEQYVEAARALGAGSRRIMFRHILPQLTPYILASLVLSTPSAIIAEAGLAILGISHGLPTWGGILADARTKGYITYWWWIFPPGILITITSMAFIFLGLALETYAEPRLRGSRS